jgi:hypothetical protein
MHQPSECCAVGWHLDNHFKPRLSVDRTADHRAIGCATVVASVWMDAAEVLVWPYFIGPRRSRQLSVAKWGGAIRGHCAAHRRSLRPAVVTLYKMSAIVAQRPPHAVHREVPARRRNRR